MKKYLLIFLTFITTFTYSFKREDIKIFSKLMNKMIPVTVILPDGYSNDKKYSVIYTLHGWSGNNKNFPEKTPIGELSDKYNVIFISPDGNYDSWYVDSEVIKKSKYSTFISKELVENIDNKYSTIKEAKNRAITGLSMGGYGAFFIGINNVNIFGNIGSMSGGLIPEDFKGNWGISKVINSNWEEYNIDSLVHKLLFTKTNIIFDCGVDDFFIESNRKVHQKLLSLNINHDYIERAGAHTWAYWSNSIKYQTLFFVENFNK
ncbi:alpha/beta hydrolase [Streptobacillus moniliformis]|uniref:alpha/beta hydrolase n=1 Tax=Streptobacillus moniliformis TaxID=34105 RepID=UPI0007E3C37C|nr:alpha/beta hydrolase family protein [Streptobacillus moniliformis]